MNHQPLMNIIASFIKIALMSGQLIVRENYFQTESWQNKLKYSTFDICWNSKLILIETIPFVSFSTVKLVPIIQVLNRVIEPNNYMFS